MAYETLVYRQDGAVLTITMNRPDKLNALTPEMLRELRQAFTRAGEDGAVRVIVLTGAGRGFCSGADLGAAMEEAASNGTGRMDFRGRISTLYNPLVMTMRTLPKPIIAAVNGVAAGAGMSLALAADFRVAAESASFVQAFVKIGLVPDSGATWMLPRLIGLTAAMDLMLSGRKVSAAEALQLRLVNLVVPADQLSEAVNALAAEYASAPTRAIALIKQAVNYALDHSLEEALANEAETQAVAGDTADHLEGVAAFLEKRPAEFKGQ